MFVEPIKNKKIYVCWTRRKKGARSVFSYPIAHFALSPHLTSPHAKVWNDFRLWSYFLSLRSETQRERERERERERFCVFGLRLESRETMGAFIKLDDSPMFLKQVQAQSDSLSYIYFFTININFYTWLVMGLDSIFNLLELDSTKIVI